MVDFAVGGCRAVNSRVAKIFTVKSAVLDSSVLELNSFQCAILRHTVFGVGHDD